MASRPVRSGRRNRARRGKDEVKDIKDEDLKHFPVETVSWKRCRATDGHVRDVHQSTDGRHHVIDGAGLRVLGVWIQDTDDAAVTPVSARAG